jgi:hypothetical protein
MSEQRQLKLGAMVHGVGHGWGEWRHPQARPNASVNFGFYKQQTQLAKAAKFDFVFIVGGSELLLIRLSIYQGQILKRA